jgi:transcriptional regulator with XRE-family HTH domain
MSETIREQRKQLKLSQSELARRAGVSRYELNVYEAGGATLRPDEEKRIQEVLTREKARILDSLRPVEMTA